MFDTYFTQIVIKLSKNMSRFVTIAHNINKRLFFWQGFYYLFFVYLNFMEHDTYINISLLPDKQIKDRWTDGKELFDWQQTIALPVF